MGLFFFEKSMKRETCNNHHFDAKLAPEFVDANLITYMTISGKPGEGYRQVMIGFGIWPRVGC
jgi:hypothetical protein